MRCVKGVLATFALVNMEELINGVCRTITIGQIVYLSTSPLVWSLIKIAAD